MVLSAIWADYIAIAPSFFDNGLSTLLIRGEIRGKGEDVVELLEFYHNTEFF